MRLKLRVKQRDSYRWRGAAAAAASSSFKGSLDRSFKVPLEWALTCKVIVEPAAPTTMLRLSSAYYGTGADWLRNTTVYCSLQFFTSLILYPDYKYSHLWTPITGTGDTNISLDSYFRSPSLFIQNKNPVKYLFLKTAKIISTYTTRDEHPYSNYRSMSQLLKILDKLYFFIILLKNTVWVVTSVDLEQWGCSKSSSRNTAYRS